MARHLRPVEPSDYAGLTQIQREVWFPLRSEAGWRWLLDDNPDQGEQPGGVVYCKEKGGPISAFIGIARIGFMRAGEPLYACTGHTMIALPEAMGMGLRLSRTVIETEGFCAYTFNNNEIAVRIHQINKARPLHAQTASKMAHWVTNPFLYARAGIGRKFHSKTGYRFMTRERDHLTHIRPLREDLRWPDHVSRIADPAAYNDACETFATRLAQEDFITCRRDHSRMSWRFSDPDRKYKPMMWVYDRGDGIEGWLIGYITKESEISAPALTIMDLISLSPALEAALPPLVEAALTAARAMGLARLSLPHFSPETEAVLKPIMARGVVKESYPHNHIHPRSMSFEEIEQNWRHTCWDGDHCFAMRQP